MQQQNEGKNRANPCCPLEITEARALPPAGRLYSSTGTKPRDTGWLSVYCFSQSPCQRYWFTQRHAAL